MHQLKEAPPKASQLPMNYQQVVNACQCVWGFHTRFWLWPWHGRAVNWPNSISWFFFPYYLTWWMLSQWKILSCSQEIFCKKGASKDSCSCVDLSSFIFLYLTWFMCIRIIDQILEPIFIKYLGFSKPSIMCLLQSWSCKKIFFSGKWFKNCFSEYQFLFILSDNCCFAFEKYNVVFTSEVTSAASFYLDLNFQTLIVLCSFTKVGYSYHHP